MLNMIAVIYSLKYEHEHNQFLKYLQGFMVLTKTVSFILELEWNVA